MFASWVCLSGRIPPSAGCEPASNRHITTHLCMVLWRFYASRLPGTLHGCRVCAGMRTFPEQLKELRRWTQQDAADELGVTRGTVNAWEKEREAPTRARVRIVRQLLETEQQMSAKTVTEADVLRRELQGFCNLLSIEQLRTLHQSAEDAVRERMNQRHVDRAEVSGEDEAVAGLRRAAAALRQQAPSPRRRANDAG